MLKTKNLRKFILPLGVLLITAVVTIGTVFAAMTNDYNMKSATANQTATQTQTTGSTITYFETFDGENTNIYRLTSKWYTAPTSSTFSSIASSARSLNLTFAKTNGSGAITTALGASTPATKTATQIGGSGSLYQFVQIPFTITVPAGYHYTDYDVVRGGVKSTASSAATGATWRINTSSTLTEVAFDSSVFLNNTANSKNVNLYWVTDISNIGMVSRYDGATTKHYWMYTSSLKPTFTLKLAPNTYSVKYNANEGSGTMSNSSHTYGKASATTVNAFTRNGYRFAGWNTKEDGTGQSVANGGNVTDLTPVHGGTVNLYAQWTPVSYDITYSGLQTGDNTGTLPTSAEFEQTITIPYPKRSGASFIGWNITGMDSSTHEYGRKKTTVTELTNIRETKFKRLRQDVGTVNFEAVWKDTAGEAYAVLDSEGNFTFFRSENSYDNNTTGTFTDIEGNSYTGRVFADFEYLSEAGEYNIKWLDYQSQIKNVTMAQSVFPKDISWWFYNCTNLVEADLSKIVSDDTEKMEGLFLGCGKLKKLDIRSLTSPQVSNMDGMIRGLNSLRRICLGNNFRFTSTARNNVEPTRIPEAYAEFDSSTGILRIFRDTKGKYTNEQTEGTKTYYSGIEDITGGTEPKWYSKRSSITKVVIEDTFAPQTAHKMFYGCGNLTEIQGIENLDTSNVTDMRYMFCSCSSLTTLDVSHFDTSNVTNMYSMFDGCSSLTTLDVSHFDTSNVTDMRSMFSDCSSLTTLDVSHFDTSNVTGMWYMFDGCSSLTTLDVSHFDTSNVTDMWSMFNGCSSLTALDVSHFDTSNVTNMYSMFYGCYNLTATLNVMNMPSSYTFMCDNTARDSGQLTLKYISPVTSTNIDTLVATKLGGNVVNGGQGTFTPPTPPIPLN